MDFISRVPGEILFLTALAAAACIFFVADFIRLRLYRAKTRTMEELANSSEGSTSHQTKKSGR